MEDLLYLIKELVDGNNGEFEFPADRRPDFKVALNNKDYETYINSVYYAGEEDTCDDLFIQLEDKNTGLTLCLVAITELSETELEKLTNDMLCN